MKQIIFFLFLSTTLQAQPPNPPVPISVEAMQRIVGEDTVIEYINSFEIVESMLLNTVLRVKGKIEGGQRFVADFAGSGTLDEWTTTGEAELCIGSNYCDFDDDGCKKGCKYYYFQPMQTK